MGRKNPEVGENWDTAGDVKKGGGKPWLWDQDVALGRRDARKKTTIRKGGKIYKREFTWDEAS